MPEETSEPETVAVVTEMNISEDRRETGIKWKKFEVEEGDELIRRQDVIELLEERIEELREKMDKRDKDPSIPLGLEFPNRYDELMRFRKNLKVKTDGNG